MSNPIKAIVGLGNPGPRYLETRHNAGFWFVDALARRAAGEFRSVARVQGDLADCLIAGERCWLLKPNCFMNRSGAAVQALMSYYKLESGSLLVAYDDLDLPPGVARFKSGGGHGGHNGLRDIHRHIGDGYHRLRLGIGHPGHKDDVSDYVLRRPRVEEQRDIEAAIDAALGVIDRYVAGDRQNATTQLHTELSNKEADRKSAP